MHKMLCLCCAVPPMMHIDVPTGSTETYCEGRELVAMTQHCGGTELSQVDCKHVGGCMLITITMICSHSTFLQMEHASPMAAWQYTRHSQSFQLQRQICILQTEKVTSVSWHRGASHVTCYMVLHLCCFCHFSCCLQHTRDHQSIIHVNLSVECMHLGSAGGAVGQSAKPTTTGSTVSVPCKFASKCKQGSYV